MLFGVEDLETESLRRYLPLQEDPRGWGARHQPLN